MFINPQQIKSRPQAYVKLLADIEKSKVQLDTRWANKAETYIPLLYRTLTKNDIKPQMARNYIVNDCSPHYWTEATVLKFLPREAKHSGRSYAGQISALKRNAKKEEESKEFDRDFPELRNERPHIKNAVKHVLPEVLKAKIEQSIKRSTNPVGCRTRIVRNVTKIIIHTTKKGIYLSPAGSSYTLYENEDGKLVKAERNL